MNSTSSTSESKTDVLIIGAGPAGLMAAWWMARCGIAARIVDKRGVKVINGHADGLRPRTEELFDSMGSGLMEKIQDQDKKISRASVENLMDDHVCDLPSPFLNITISQGRIERFLLDAIHELSEGRLHVERGVVAESLTYDPLLEPDHGAYPITINLRTLPDSEANPKPADGAFGGRDVLATANLPPDESQNGQAVNRTPNAVETVKARYLIGSDGAHSWLREQLGYRTEGSQTDSIWGVMDIVPMTNFPDIYYPCLVKGELGTLMVVPRERNLTRIYVPFPNDHASERFDRSSITLQRISDKAKKFFEPYEFDFTVCEWWSVYQVSQRVAERCGHPGNRMFLAGDAVHMHSPKVGLGMNTSMQDGFNLGWKIALAASGAVRAESALLDTYQAERLPVGQKLVRFDHSLFSSSGGLDPAEFRRRHTEFKEFAQGRKLEYPQSILIDKHASTQSVAAGLPVGESFKHAKILGHANSQLAWTTKVFKSDGRFRIVLMAGGVSVPGQMQRVEQFCARLESEKLGDNGKATSLLHTRYQYPFKTSSNAAELSRSTAQHPHITYRHERAPMSFVSLVAIHTAIDAHDTLPLLAFPSALRGPFDPNYHGWDASRLFVDAPVHYDRYCDGLAYSRWGIDRLRGAVVVVRPDMHVGWVGELEDDGLERYFAKLFD
ncbi:Monooxygenase, FAD-binding protein [Akanthomyces lecanii RCEF 1005]|uniref:Monooxygenase, FAD-binding protein n=1 Tax=Akanthomyces lecanii RCEF 1005 TaxID=1081108 RepID=A0A162JS36_CORDF|nr:Monooxygenase, FAD-binding protein [Akanthomyces lecanii RCEF 1005]